MTEISYGNRSSYAQFPSHVISAGDITGLFKHLITVLTMQAEEYKRVFSYFKYCLCPVRLSNLDSEIHNRSVTQLGFHDHISIFRHQMPLLLDEATCNS